MGLTVKRMARLTKPERYLDRDGLYLVVESATSCNWTLRYQLWGKERWMGLRSVETFSLEEARQRAHKARQLLSDGIDPLEARRRRTRTARCSSCPQQDLRRCHRRVFRRSFCQLVIP
jgi:hypothetical protein